MSTGLCEATNALSVYNLVNMSKTDMPVPEVIEALRKFWNPGFDGSDMAEAIEFLEGKGFAKLSGGVVKVPRDPMTKQAPKLMRSADRYDLFKVGF